MERIKAKVKIPGTTLCCIDCINYDLSIRAMENCLKVCGFDRALFLTDRVSNSDCGIEVVRIPPISSKEEYSRFVIKELNDYIDTAFVLMVQYDGFIVNPAEWAHEFQRYDYVGATWHWYNDGFNVGNGGFSLRSKRLLQALGDGSISENSVEHGEDTLICRTYRSFLEKKYGIIFAPEHLADRFSYERSDFPGSHPFGFHGLYNMWRYLGPEYLMEFLDTLSRRTLKSIEALELGTNYHKSGQVEEAEVVYRKILEVSPDNKEALTYLKILRSGLKSGDGAGPRKKRHDPGRNDACPCGSGRKFKKCCGA